jgi:sulfopropanediol 3-dehydrogenase
MATYLKQGISPEQSNTVDKKIRAAVETILDEVELHGDEAVRRYSQQFDHWSPAAFRLQPEEIAGLVAQVPQQTLQDIEFAQAQVRKFAEAQRQTIRALEVELQPGVTLGHRILPVNSVGCYIPGGRYPLVSSAHMSIIPAKVAGVKRVIACTPPAQGKLPAATVAAMALAGADEIYILGGVQAVAAMAIGTQSIQAVDMIVGPGNAYVAEAKRQLYGRVGIDLFAGPSEVLVIADESIDAQLVAADLLGQAEHGVNSPAVLLTTSAELGRTTLIEIENQLKMLPTVDIAAAAWRDYGQVILVADEAEAVREADRLAFEHVEVLTKNPRYFLERLTNYG